MTDLITLEATHATAVERSTFLANVHGDILDAMEAAVGAIVVDKFDMRDIDRLDFCEFYRLIQDATRAYLDTLVCEADEALTESARAIEEHEWDIEDARWAAE